MEVEVPFFLMVLDATGARARPLALWLVVFPLVNPIAGAPAVIRKAFRNAALCQIL